MSQDQDKSLDIETRLELVEIELEFAKKLIDEFSEKIDKMVEEFGGK
jgi:hypothetical protein